MKKKTYNKENLKILLITQNFPPETVGGATHNFEIAKYLSILGCNVDVITTYPTYPYGEFNRGKKLFTKEIIDNINVTRIWTFQPRKSSPSQMERFIQYAFFSLIAFMYTLLRKNYKILVTSQPPDFIFLSGYFLKKIVRKPWVIDVRDLWLECALTLDVIDKSGLSYKILEKVRKKALETADVFAYTAPTIKNWLDKNYRIKCISIYNPNGISIAEYPHFYEIGKNLIYVGNIGFAYDLKNIIDSLQYVNDKNLRLLIRGGGDKKPELEDYISTLNLQDRVLFVEKLPRAQLLSLIARSRIGLCPLKSNNPSKTAISTEAVIPTKVIEYMGCGIPFIGSGKGEIVRLAEESGAGIITNSEPQDIAKAINKLNDNVLLCKKMGENGRKYVEKTYDKLMIIKELYEVINKLD